jgi:glycosyltransferase involved in cell wall biosynthesis
MGVKIALLTDCYPPRLGGIEVQVRDLAHRLAESGHQVEVFTATIGADDARGGLIETSDGVTVHRMGILLPGRLPVNPLAAGEVRRRLAAGRFDVAHVHMGIISPFTVDCTHVALQVGLPVAMTWHCMLGPGEPLFHLTQVARIWAKRGVTMSAVSATAAVPVQRVIGAAGRVAVVPNGIDLARWWTPDTAEHPAMPAPSDGDLRVVTAMRLAMRKRPFAVLDVMAKVRRRMPEAPVRLTILGDGRLRPAVEQAIRRRDMQSWVDLPGRVDRQTLLQRYAESHLYLSPAKLESFGIAALEARCVGLPVVGLRSSGASDFITDGVNGYLAQDDEGMAARVAELLGDHEARERMFRYNLSVPPAQDWAQVVATTIGEYRRAAAARGRRIPGDPLNGVAHPPGPHSATYRRRASREERSRVLPTRR